MLAISSPLHLLDKDIPVVLVELVGKHGLVGVQRSVPKALHVLLVEVEIDALVVYLLLQYFVVLVLDKFRQGLLIVYLRDVLLRRRGHREFKVVVEVAKAIDHGAQLLVLLLQHLNFVRQAMNLVYELFGVLDLPLLLFE